MSLLQTDVANINQYRTFLLSLHAFNLWGELKVPDSRHGGHGPDDIVAM